MHNLAIALHQKGLEVTGSDDEIYEPSRSRLDRHGLLPDEMGWHPGRISSALDAVILGMHARADNPELVQARALGLRIFSYPEFIYEQTKHKTRVVVGGSHGKTTITSMIIHVLRKVGKDVDYLVGAQLEGFDCMVRLSNDAPIAVIEGDEYLSSPIDRRPKFHLYRPNIAVISGIAWDHINVFPTFGDYVEQFEIFIDLIEPGGTLVYSADDEQVERISLNGPESLRKVPYKTPAHRIEDGVTYLENGNVRLSVFGEHNLQNMEAARGVCAALGVDEGSFNEAISSFTGASKRLELIAEHNGKRVFKDFAHSPSKLRASVTAVKHQFAEQPLTAVMELHTFSSLNEDFIQQYAGTMDAADKAVLYYDRRAVEMKRATVMSPEQLLDAFGRTDMEIVGDPIALMGQVRAVDNDKGVLLLMTSGTMGGTDLNDIAEAFIA